MQSVVGSALSVGVTALQVANIGGAPFAAAAAGILLELERSCEQVKIHKSKCRSLIHHANTILDSLRSGISGLEGTRLLESADELEMILEKINRQMSKWAEYNLIRSWLSRDDIAKSILRADQQLEAHLAKFHITAQIVTYQDVHEAESLRRRDQDETRAVLDEILANQRRLLELRTEGHAVKDIMMAAQTELHQQPRDSPRYHDYERNVFNLYKTTGVMPTLPDLSLEVIRQQGHPVAGGTYSDVWLGTWSGHVQVALKSLREVKVSSGALKKFEHEVKVWHILEHPHILRLMGVVSNLGPHVHVVSPWQCNGNALEYVKNHPEVNRLKLLTGAAYGVEYLHSRDLPVVHGNLKCANILVSDKGQALISDFGLSRVVGEITDTAASVTLTTTGSSRWCAPEIMSGKISLPTLSSDIYSFAMAILECLTTEKPFAHLKRDTRVVIEVMDQGRPPRPEGSKWERWFTEELWELLESCWGFVPSSRPQMRHVTSQLRLHAEPWDNDGIQ